MRRTMLLAGLLALGAATSALAQRPRGVIAYPGEVTDVFTDTTGTPYPIPFPRASAIAALRAVLGKYKVPITEEDSVAGRFANLNFWRRETFAGKRISSFFSCGEGITGPNADSYRIYMVLRVLITADGPDRSTMRTVLLGGGVNVSEGSRQAMPCESNGRFEIQLHREVVQRAAGL